MGIQIMDILIPETSEYRTVLYFPNLGPLVCYSAHDLNIEHEFPAHISLLF